MHNLPRSLWLAALMCAASAWLLACGIDAPPAQDDDGQGDLACTPDLRECLDPSNFRVCRPDGSGFDFGTCPQNQPCNNGLCSGGGGPGPNPGPDAGAPDAGDPGDTGGPGPDVDDSTEGPCTPFERVCISPTQLKVCRGDGSGFDLGICQQDQPCEDGFCGGIDGTPGTCTPNERTCLDGRTVRICLPDGSAFDEQFCPNGQACQDGACRSLENCQDADGDGYGVGPDCLGPDCNDDNFSISPEGFEVCESGVDEDCDGIDPPCACDPVAQDCPGERLKCALGRQNTFECRSDGILGEGELCGGIPSNCSRGLICIITDDDNQSRCTRICDPGNGRGCVGDAVCGATLNGFDDVGLCLGATRCDPVDNPTACAPGTTCQPISDRDALCFDGGGNLGENASCDPNNDQCSPGMTCVTIQGGDNAGNRCKAFCKVARGNADCNNRQGRACSPLEFSFTLNGRNETIRAYGICN